MNARSKACAAEIPTIPEGDDVVGGRSPETDSMGVGGCSLAGPLFVVAIDCGSRDFGLARFALAADGPELLDRLEVRIPARIRGLGTRLVAIAGETASFLRRGSPPSVVIVEAPIPSWAKNGFRTALIAGAVNGVVRERVAAVCGLEVDEVPSAAWKARLRLPQKTDKDATREYVNGRFRLALSPKEEDAADAIALGAAACEDIVEAGGVDAWRQKRADLEVEKRAARKAKRERKLAKAARP